MNIEPLSLLVFLSGLALPFVVLGYAAYDTARWQRCEALKEDNNE